LAAKSDRLLGLEYFCFEGDRLCEARDEHLLALGRRELAKIGLASESECVDGCVVRQKKACPVYDDGYKRNLEAIRTELAAKYSTLHLVGRNGMHKYNNQDHAMMTAMLTIKNTIAGEQLYDIWNVNEGAEYHEAGHMGKGAFGAHLRTVRRRVGWLRKFINGLAERRGEEFLRFARYVAVSGSVLGADFAGARRAHFGARLAIALRPATWCCIE
jgi:hypothetical protein